MEKGYNEKCDIWSCGVILYLLITGGPPFYGDTRDSIIAQIKAAKIDYGGTNPNHTLMVAPVWSAVSPDCKSLLKRMLTYDPAKRISAGDAMKHPFIVANIEQHSISGEDLRVSLSNLRNFRTQKLLQKAVLTYIASQQLLQQDEAKFRKIFDTFDLNRDGQLTIEELIQGYTRLYGDPKKAKKQAEQIMRNIDLNHNGFIEYNGTHDGHTRG